MNFERAEALENHVVIIESALIRWKSALRWDLFVANDAIRQHSLDSDELGS